MMTLLRRVSLGYHDFQLHNIKIQKAGAEGSDNAHVFARF